MTPAGSVICIVGFVLMLLGGGGGFSAFWFLVSIMGFMLTVVGRLTEHNSGR